MAETILAQACENESNNAKRMRMGLEPLPAHSVTNFRLLYNLLDLFRPIFRSRSWTKCVYGKCNSVQKLLSGTGTVAFLL